MSNQMNDYDLEKALLNAVKEINLENAVQTEPVYSLTEILALKNVTELRQLGKLLQVKYYGKLPKAELIPAIAETLKQSDTLRNCLYTLDEIEWEFFQKAAAKKHLQTNKVYIDSYRIPQKMGLLQCFYHKDSCGS